VDPLSGERKLAAILNSLGEAVITVDRDHRISQLQPGGFAACGDTGGGGGGERIAARSFAPRSGPGAARLPDGGARRGGEAPGRRRGDLVRADGRIVPVSASWAFFTSETGEVHGFVISFRSFEEIERIAEERKSKFPFPRHRRNTHSGIGRLSTSAHS